MNDEYEKLLAEREDAVDRIMARRSYMRELLRLRDRLDAGVGETLRPELLRLRPNDLGELSEPARFWIEYLETVVNHIWCPNCNRPREILPADSEPVDGPAEVTQQLARQSAADFFGL